MIRTLILAALCAFATASHAETQELSLSDMRAKWGTADSRYVTLDGIEVHYVDQGPRDAPAIVMLHASFVGLRTLDGLADSLSDRFRVVRFDLTNHGLTGPDGKEENSYARNQQILRLLTAELGLQRYSLVGTSSGGPIAFRHAAEYPETVARMVLINSAGMPRTAQTNPNAQLARATGRDDLGGQRTRESVAAGLDFNFIDPHPAPEWLIDYSYDGGRRAGIGPEMARFMSSYAVGDPQATLAKVTAPTLIIWGIDNPTVMHLNADVMRHWMTSAPTALIKLPGTGHYAYLEEPELVQDAVSKFFDGAMDDQLRQTTMIEVKP